MPSYRFSDHTFPPEPGVYLMKNAKGAVIYVGKAKNLRTRLGQYFVRGRDSRLMVPFLLQELDAIETILTLTEKEALLLENTLIKKHQPKFNALLKDDKTFISIMINPRHPWPRLQLVRYKGKPPVGGLFFGPYTSAASARATVALLQRLFPLRQCSDEELKRRKRPCLLHEIGQCIAPCVQKCTSEEYHEFVQAAISFLSGKTKEVLQQLRTDMEKASDALEYETASHLLTTIRQVEETTREENLTVRARGRGQDVLALHRNGFTVVLVQLLFREGKLIGSEPYTFSEIAETDAEIYTSFLLQHYGPHTHSTEPRPQEVVLPLRLDDAPLLEEILGLKIAPPTGDRKQLVHLAKKNAESLATQKGQEADRREALLLDLQEKLHLSHYPETIVCIDISNLSGSDPVAAAVAFVGGLPHRAGTRLFKVREAGRSDDYGALREVATRYLTRMKETEQLPDLLLIDGGKGHLNVVAEIFRALDIATVDLAAIAKEEGRHDKGATQERLFLPHHAEPVILELRSPLLFFLQKIRDRSHEKAITFQQERRGKRLIGSSLTDLPGIGKVKAQRLLAHFGSVKRTRAASAAELKTIPGITQRDIEKILGK
jgi:excinuclease ABC subunit C